MAEKIGKFRVLRDFKDRSGKEYKRGDLAEFGYEESRGLVNSDKITRDLRELRKRADMEEQEGDAASGK